MAFTADIRPSLVADTRSFNKASPFSVPVRISLATVPATATNTTKVYRVAADDVVYAQIKRRTAAGATCTVDLVTDETSPQTLFSAASLNTTGTIESDGSTGTATVNGATRFRIVSDCNLVLTFNHTNSTAVFDVVVFVNPTQIPAAP
jgi:hypothetical protein